MTTTLTRRSMLRSFAGLAAGRFIVPGIAAIDEGALGRRFERLLASQDESTTDDPTARGELLESVPFLNRQRDTRPREQLYGEGLEGRYRQDLTMLSRETLITPTDRFFVRTRAPVTLGSHDPWRIRIGGKVRSPIALTMDELRAHIVPRGVHLMECSGNGLGGLISAATWRGIPFDRVLERSTPDAGIRHVLVQGLDEHANVPRDHWQSGASWIFSFDQLKQAGAFLATHMNDEPLTPDHGAPVRLLVPGWYGCTCIKWVNAINFIDAAAPSTAQMREFASRTNQSGVPKRASDYKPAVIDLAAMPVRIERRRLDNGEIVYRIVGVIWGGNQLIEQLFIHIALQQDRGNRGGRVGVQDDDDGEAGSPTPVDHFVHETNRTWSLWSHIWRPSAPGRYVIQMSLGDAPIVSRKMSRGTYRRQVDIKTTGT